MIKKIKINPQKNFVFSLGGSVLFKKNKFDLDYLNSFLKFVKGPLNERKNGKIIISVGGGVFAREYINALRSLGIKDEFFLDRLGLRVVDLNAFLVLEAFKGLAYEKVVKNPFYIPKTNKRVIIYGGFKPGFSSDYVASACAKVYNTNIVFNLTNVRFLYDRDPKKFRKVKVIVKTSWKDFIDLAGEFTAGKNFPFDPVASRFCQKNNLKVVILDGRDFSNLRNAIHGKSFEGSLIY